MIRASWVLQILILAFGIYLFLRLVRTTRGSRLIRVLIALLVGLVGLWGLAETLELEELLFLLQGVSGFVVVIFVILFQDELRRGIAQLGENPLLGRWMSPASRDTARRVARALTALAEERRGALIAFERESPLDPYVERGVRMDSDVNRLLLESIFFPGSTLHDGAVVVRKDRIVAAACILPLSESASLDRTTGTRHRAALGLAEVTDAVCAVVSEETGAISIANHGAIELDVPRDELEHRLRAALSGGPSSGRPSDVRRRVGRTAGSLSGDLLWIGVSLVLGTGLWYAARRETSLTRTFSVELHAGPLDGAPEPIETLEIRIASSRDLRVVDTSTDRNVQIEVSGTRAELDDIGASLSGTLAIIDPEPGLRDIDLSKVRWTHGVPGLSYGWPNDRPEQIEIQVFRKFEVALDHRHLPLLAGELDPRYVVDREDITFDPSVFHGSGPSSSVERLESGELEFRLAPIEIDETRRNDFERETTIHPELRVVNGLRYEGERPIRVRIPITPAPRDLGPVTKEIAIVSLDPARADEIGRWALPARAQTARFTIETLGLVPASADVGSQVYRERALAITRFVEENLRVYVDVGELPVDGGARALEVRYVLHRELAEAPEYFGLAPEALGGREKLDVSLQSDRTVLLVEREEADAASNGGQASGDDFGGGL